MRFIKISLISQKLGFSSYWCMFSRIAPLKCALCNFVAKFLEDCRFHIQTEHKNWKETREAIDNDEKIEDARKMKKVRKEIFDSMVEYLVGGSW